ncbi:exopolygalacturonase-like [Juglans microcarpa x Juglans regia]|uniref:exopolygalacturonase-like n=1 Tax=Juglans microcarpa x Juglans regia TaxID=2249226 RepID=UPI001B7E7D18|nr:exopolygalacturonase-like [Juglans microcarpa x Juglans regia]
MVVNINIKNNAERAVGVRAIVVIVLFALATACCEAKGGRHVGRVTPRVDPFRGAHLGRTDIAGRNEKVFNVLQFGAKPDGRKDCTQSFVRAWRAACDFKGRSRLLIPGGTFLLSEIVFAGPCSGPDPKIVQVIGTVKATTDVSEYSSSEWVLFESINGLVITGRGTFDGQGDAVWKYNDCRGNSNCVQLPSNIKFNKVTGGVLRGITSLNSKGVHIFITNCDNIRVRKVNVIAPEDSPNTDGIHVSHSNNVKIARTVIRTGDDCISMIQGATNVAINKVACGPGHGISVGSLGKYPHEEDVRGIYVKNCTFTGTDNGVRIKTWPGSDLSAASGMLFQDLIMNNVKNPIIIDQGYCGGSKSRGCNKSPSRVKISTVHYVNIRGTSTTPEAVKLICSSQFPCQDVHFYNIDLKYQRSGATATCSNAKAWYAGRQNPPPCK